MKRIPDGRWEYTRKRGLTESITTTEGELATGKPASCEVVYGKDGKIDIADYLDP